MTLLAFTIFGGAFAIAAYAIWSTIAPNMDRITAALFGRVEVPFTPLTQLAHAERRIAVRRWAGGEVRQAGRSRAAA